MKKTKVTCPHCSKSFQVNPASLLGSIKSTAKSEASRLNGKLGGRPRKEKLIEAA